MTDESDEQEVGKTASPSSVLLDLISKAIDAGADALEVEHKDGREQCCAMKGRLGFGIASFESGSTEGSSLRQDLYRMSKKTGNAVDLSDRNYHLEVQVFDSFGDDAFRITIRASK